MSEQDSTSSPAVQQSTVARAIAWRVACTFIAGTIYYWAKSLYTYASVPIVIEKSLGQMNGATSPYDPAFALNSFILAAMPWTFAFVLVAIWLPLLWRLFRELDKDMRGPLSGAIALAVFLGAFLVNDRASAYYSTRNDDEYFQCGSNETCFQVGFTKDTIKSQAAFKSEQFYLESKVATARFLVPHMVLPKQGMLTSDMYIPAAQFLVVTRAPVWRHWTSDNKTGSSDKNQGFEFESKDSINIKVNGTCIAFITEENAHKYLRWYGVVQDKNTKRDDPNAIYATAVMATPLEAVMDTEAHGLMQTILFEEFGKEEFKDVYKKKSEINKTLREKMASYFEPRGVTIGNCSMAGSLTFEPEIQKAINDEQIANNAATDKMMAYRERNADIMVREGLAKGLSEKGLPSTLLIPSSDLIGAFVAGSTAGTKVPKPIGTTAAPTK